MTIDKFYFKLRYLDKITDYKKVFETSKEYLKKPFDSKYAAQKYYQKNGGINQYFCDVLNQHFHNVPDVSMDQLKEIQNIYEEYHELYKMYYSHGREEIFKNPEKILDWYHRQGKKCGYCGVTQDELHLIVESREGNLTLNNLQKRSKGTLEIEKRDPTKGYTFDNIILACPLCNNAKSNLIDDDSWKTMFAPIMRQYYDKLLLKCYKEEGKNE